MNRPPLFSPEGLCALLVFCAIAVIPAGLIALLTAWLLGASAGSR